MAYFANSSTGIAFDMQCDKCRYGESPCPIARVQTVYNYDAADNPLARKILDELVKNDGTCEMFKILLPENDLKKDLKKLTDRVNELESGQKDLFSSEQSPGREE